MVQTPEQTAKGVLEYTKSLKPMRGRELFNELFKPVKRKLVMVEIKEKADEAGMDADKWMYLELKREFELVGRSYELHKNQEATQRPFGPKK
jgi:hypothetical protein